MAGNLVAGTFPTSEKKKKKGNMKTAHAPSSGQSG